MFFNSFSVNVNEYLPFSTAWRMVSNLICSNMSSINIWVKYEYGVLGIRVPGGAFEMAPATGQSKINYILCIYVYRLIYIKK